MPRPQPIPAPGSRFSRLFGREIGWFRRHRRRRSTPPETKEVKPLVSLRRSARSLSERSRRENCLKSGRHVPISRSGTDRGGGFEPHGGMPLNQPFQEFRRIMPNTFGEVNRGEPQTQRTHAAPPEHPATPNRPTQGSAIPRPSGDRPVGSAPLPRAAKLDPIRSEWSESLPPMPRWIPGTLRRPQKTGLQVTIDPLKTVVRPGAVAWKQNAWFFHRLRLQKTAGKPPETR